MSSYCIKDLENLSGIKAHTIRIWEKRYDLIQPHRTSSNIRRYDNNQLKKLLNVSLLIKEGYKISKIASLSLEEMQEIVNAVHERNTDSNSFVDMMVNAALDFNEKEIDRIIEEIFAQFGIIDSMQNVLFPFAEKFGILWLTSQINSANEQFMYCILRRKLFASINDIHVEKDGNKPSFLLFLPEGEYAELYLLFYYYFIKSEGYPIVYLGQNTSSRALEDVLDKKPDSILFTSVPPQKICLTLSSYLQNISYLLKKNKLFLAVPNNFHDSQSKEEGLFIIKSLNELSQKL